MRSFSGLLLSLLAAAAACTGATSGEPLAPDAPIAGPNTPVVPDAPPADDGASADGRTAEEVCTDLDDIGTRTGNACTEMGCVSGFHLSVEPTGSWPHGDYRYVLDVDGRSVTCEGSLPLKPCGASNITCSDPAFGVVESGCALEASAHAFGGVSIPGFPSNVHLLIEHDGKPVFDQDLAPRWSRVQPNGPGCEPVCCQASAMVALKF